MNSCTIYEVTVLRSPETLNNRKFYSLRPWAGNDCYYEGWDDGGKEYMLPEGYNVAMDALGMNQVYGPGGRVHWLFGQGNPRLQASDQKQYTHDGAVPLIRKV